MSRSTVGAGGGDQGGDGGRSLTDALALKVGEHLSGLGHLVHLVKADLQQGVKHDVNVVQIVELPIEGRLRQGNAIFIPGQHIQTVAHRLDSLVGTDPDALAAVDAAVGQDGGLAAPDANGLGGAAFDAGGTAPAAAAVQYHGMLHRHGTALPPFARDMIHWGILILTVTVVPLPTSVSMVISSE